MSPGFARPNAARPIAPPRARRSRRPLAHAKRTAPIDARARPKATLRDSVGIQAEGFQHTGRDQRDDDAKGQGGEGEDQHQDEPSGCDAQRQPGLRGDPLHPGEQCQHREQDEPWDHRRVDQRKQRQRGRDGGEEQPDGPDHLACLGQGGTALATSEDADHDHDGCADGDDPCRRRARSVDRRIQVGDRARRHQDEQCQDDGDLREPADHHGDPSNVEMSVILPTSPLRTRR